MILPYILNTICWINVTPGILVPCDPIIDVKIYLCWCDLYFMVPVILPYILNTICWCDLYFMVPVILPYILNTICWINVTPGILVPCDPMNDHLLYLGHCDLYFMVQ